MFFLLSGEGPSDIGTAVGGALVCVGEDFRHGPMTAIVDKIVEKEHSYSILEVEACGFVSEGRLEAGASELKAVKKAIGLPGKKRARETRYFFNSARILARMAHDQEEERDDAIVAVLFHDSDGTASAGRGLWSDKRQSMLDGFEEEGFERGVPMVPKPKSEAWLLCALKANPYENCEQLENRSGNDRSPKSLKGDLDKILGDAPLIETLCEQIAEGVIDIDRIDMPSFTVFHERLLEVI